MDYDFDASMDEALALLLLAKKIGQILIFFTNLCKKMASGTKEAERVKYHRKNSEKCPKCGEGSGDSHRLWEIHEFCIFSKCPSPKIRKTGPTAFPLCAKCGVVKIHLGKPF
jgi:ribosomal protein S27AE